MPRENADVKKINSIIIDAGHLHEHVKALRFYAHKCADEFG
jgi:hypothetical protein